MSRRPLVPDFGRMQAFGVALAESSALVKPHDDDDHTTPDESAPPRHTRPVEIARYARPSSPERKRDDRLPVRAAVAVARARAEQKRYRACFEALPLACVFSDRSGVVVRMNGAARRLFGVDEASAVGGPIERWFDLSFSDALRKGLERVDREAVQLRARLATGTRSDGAPPRERSAAERDLVDVHAARISRKEILWTITVDASAREASLSRRLLDKDEVIERQRQRIEALERSCRTKDKFIAVLGHDLRAPLNAVLGWTQLMRRELLDAVGRERALATIERNARSQAALIEELLDVTRLNEGRLALEISACDVGIIVRRTIEAALPQASAKDVRLVTQVRPGVTVAGDRARLEQVLNNLVSNALKFTPAGGSIEVTVSREGGQARIDVRDTGKGIAPEQLPHVFKWLHQGSDVVPTREGLGLGLFIVQRLVELHGGTVRAASDGPGRGATFTVLLPCCEPDVAPLPSSTVLPELGELDGVEILVVEDESDAVELLSRVLATRGARVTSARDGGSALAFALPRRPEVIVTDLGLPDMDGYELVRRVRAAHGGAVGIVALTGYAAKDYECNASAGFDERLTKPVDIPRLVRAVQQAARCARARSADAQAPSRVAGGEPGGGP